MALDFNESVASVDINPLMVLPEGQGIVAVDVLVELGGMKSQANGEQSEPLINRRKTGRLREENAVEEEPGFGDGVSKVKGDYAEDS